VAKCRCASLAPFLRHNAQLCNEWAREINRVYI
jgi:hypothetical protein